MVIASGSKGLKGKKVFSIICISHKRKSNSQRKTEEICFREKLHGNRFWEKSTSISEGVLLLERRSFHSQLQLK